MGKIAVLLYGQPRFIEDSIDSIKKEFSIPGFTTDYFFHFWDAVAYKSTDKENPINHQKIIDIVSPVNYSFTDYTQLDKQSQEILDNVVRNKVVIKNHGVIKPQNIFSVKEPKHLKYYLGQFLSLQNVTELLEQYINKNNIKYDIVFRVRTDLFFTGELWYDSIRAPDERILNNTEELHSDASVNEYEYDKYLTYIKPVERYKSGIFVNKGELGVWEKFKVIQDDIIDSTKISFTGREKITSSCVEFDPNHYLVGMRRDGRKDISIFDKEYIYNYIDFHIKDWLIWGTQEAIINTNKQLINAVKFHIKRSAQRLNVCSRDNNWGSGEIITGLAAYLSKNNMYDVPLCISRISAMQMRRFFKIINEHSKENMLGLDMITVRHDTPGNMKKSCIRKYREQIRIDKGNEHK